MKRANNFAFKALWRSDADEQTAKFYRILTHFFVFVFAIGRKLNGVKMDF